MITMGVPTTDRGGIQQTIRALRAAGYELRSVDDGGEDVAVTNETEALDAITAVDSAHLYVELPGVHTGCVFFVLGNDPEEIICDHTVNLSPVLDALIDSWIDAS